MIANLEILLMIVLNALLDNGRINNVGINFQNKTEYTIDFVTSRQKEIATK